LHVFQYHTLSVTKKCATLFKIFVSVETGMLYTLLPYWVADIVTVSHCMPWNLAL